MQNTLKLALAGGILALVSQGPARAAQPFTLSSPEFQDGALMPRSVGGNLAANPNCVGDNKSPALSWINPPAGTKSFVLTMVDPESRAGLGTNHWVIYGIPASTTALPEGVGSGPTAKFIAGTGTEGRTIFSGPCTAPPATHHYTFVLIATDLAPDALAPGLTREDLLKKLPGHVKLATGLIGRFTKPTN